MKIVNRKNIPETGLSHDPEIKKRVLIGHGEIPELTIFGESIFKPGQSVEKHAHDTMYEVFYVCSGKAIFTVNGKEFEVSEGDCITIEPKEEHSPRNPFDTEVKWLYFGIATD